MTFTVLAVCTGNICRSPVMELLLRAQCDSSITVSSAGTSGLPSWPMSQPMAALLARDGQDPHAFASQRLSPTLLLGAQLILTATAQHRTQVLEMEPLALRRCFTLREFVRLLGGQQSQADGAQAGRAWPGLAASTPARASSGHTSVTDAARMPDVVGMTDAARMPGTVGTTDAERLALLVAQAVANRRFNTPGPAGFSDDIDDPYRRGDQAYAQAYAQIVDQVSQLVHALRASSANFR